MTAEAAGGIHSKAPVWADMGRNNVTPQETEHEKLKKTNVWDYAATAQQAGAYAG